MKRQLSHRSQMTASNGSDATNWTTQENRSSSSSLHNMGSNTFVGNDDVYNNDLTLSACLKRFKISTTPGELRLSKDMEQLIKEHDWVTSQHMTHQSNLTTFSTNRLLSPDGTLSIERDSVDPLRLRVQSPFFEFLLQIPRMYPHSPPSVYRITRCNSSNFVTASSCSMSTTSSDRPTLYPSSSCVPPPPSHTSGVGIDNFTQHFPNIVVSNEVLAQNNKPTNTSHPSTQHDLEQNTVIYNNWNPISRLVDLLSWLKDYPFDEEQRNAPSLTINTLQNVGSGGIQQNLNTLSTESHIQVPPQCTGEQSAQSRSIVSLHSLDMETETNMSMETNHDSSTDSSSMSSSSFSPKNNTTNMESENSEIHNNKAYSLFQPNRFDIGFPKYSTDFERDSHSSMMNNSITKDEIME